eukprot:TCONS_00035397-protein
MFCYDISKTLLTTMFKHFHENGPVLRVHGNTINDAHTMPLVSRREKWPSSDDDAKLLLIPSFKTKESVHNQYKALFEGNGFEFMGFSSFCELWKSQLPNVIITKPMGDLCWVCQQGNKRLLKSKFDSDDYEADEMGEAHGGHIE